MQATNWAKARDAWNEETKIGILLNRINYKEEHKHVGVRNLTSDTVQTVGETQSVLQGGNEWRQ